MARYWIILKKWSNVDTDRAGTFCSLGSWDFQEYGTAPSAENDAKIQIRRMRKGHRIAIAQRWKKGNFNGITVQHLGIIEDVRGSSLTVCWAVSNLGRKLSGIKLTEIISGPYSETSTRVKKVFLL